MNLPFLACLFFVNHMEPLVVCKHCQKLSCCRETARCSILHVLSCTSARLCKV